MSERKLNIPRGSKPKNLNITFVSLFSFFAKPEQHEANAVHIATEPKNRQIAKTDMRGEDKDYPLRDTRLKIRT